VGPEVSLGEVGILTAHLDGVLKGEVLDSLKRAELVLDVECLSRGVDPPEGVAREAVHESPSDGSSVIAPEPSVGEHRLGSQRHEVKHRIVVDEEVLWVAGLRPDDVGTKHGVSAEEDREVDAKNIIVALLGVELESETAGIASAVRELLAVGDRAESAHERSLLSHSSRTKELGLRVSGHVLAELEVSHGTRAAGVDRALYDLASVEHLLLLHEEDIADDGMTGDL